MKQKIKFVKHFMSVVVAAVMVFATVAGIGNFFPNIKSEAATRQTLYICDIKSGGFSANYTGYTSDYSKSFRQESPSQCRAVRQRAPEGACGPVIP